MFAWRFYCSKTDYATVYSISVSALHKATRQEVSIEFQRTAHHVNIPSLEPWENAFRPRWYFFLFDEKKTLKLAENSHGQTVCYTVWLFYSMVNTDAMRASKEKQIIYSLQGTCLHRFIMSHIYNRHSRAHGSLINYIIKEVCILYSIPSLYIV